MTQLVQQLAWNGVSAEAQIIAADGKQVTERLLNAADPDVPMGRDIARIVAETLGHDWAEVLVDGDEQGGHPWDVVPGIELDLSAATALVESLWLHFTQTLPQWGVIGTVADFMPLAYFPFIAVAFTVALGQASSSDRVRIHWAAGSILVGFLGPIVQTLLSSMFHVNTNFGGLFGNGL